MNMIDAELGVILRKCHVSGELSSKPLLHDAFTAKNLDPKKLLLEGSHTLNLSVSGLTTADAAKIMFWLESLLKIEE